MMLNGKTDNHMLGREKKPKVRKNRLKKNRAGQRRRWWGHLLLGLKLTVLIALLLGASALFMLGYAAVTHSDYFRTATITVKGNHHLSKSEIISKAGIQRGDNLLALNLRLVRGRLLGHAWIESARVWREIPEAITIEVKEHAALAKIDWERPYLINTQGRIFKPAAPGDPEDLPLVSGIGLDDISLGSDRLSPGMRSVVQVLRLSQRRDSAIAFAEIERLHVDRELGLKLILKKNKSLIKLGFDAYDTKYERFRQLRLQLQGLGDGRDFKVVDLTIPDRVVVRLEAEGSNG